MLTRTSFPLSATVDELSAALPGPLTSRAALERIGRVCRELPAAVTDWLYFECHLSGAATRIDLIVGVERRAGSLDDRLLAPRTPTAEPLTRVARAWRDPDSLLSRMVHRIWLEYDLATDNETEPGIFADFRRASWGHRGLPGWPAAAVGAMRSLAPAGAANRVTDDLDALLKDLPPDARVPCLGVFPGRGGRWRCCVVGDPDAATRLGVVGRTGGELLRRGDVRIGMVHHDLASSEERIGVELPFGRESQIAGRLDEMALLDRLVATGHAKEGRVMALRRWPGVEQRHFAHTLSDQLLVRRVNHLKLVFGPTQLQSIKAYLSVGIGATGSRAHAT